MAQLYYCKTHYDCEPPVDINPLITRRYPQGKILVLCARDGMVKRISKLSFAEYPEINVAPIGWWEFKDYGLIDQYSHLISTEILDNDAVVIIGRDRIDPIFHSLLKAVEFLFCEKLTPAA